MASLGDIVTRLTVDKRQFETGLSSVSRDLSRVRGEISKVSAQAAAGNERAFLQLVSLVAQEEELARTAKRAAEIETRARQSVIGLRKEELHVLAQQEAAEKRVAATAQRTAAVRMSSTGRVAAGSGMGARQGLAMAGTAAAFGASDAATAFGFGGGRAAVMATANNLPMIGLGLSQAAPALARLGGTLGMLASRAAMAAGPIGLVASVVLPIFSNALGKWIDSLFEAQRALDSVETALGRTTAAREQRERVAGLGSNPQGLAEQRDRVAGLRTELGDAQATRASLARAFARTDVANGWMTDTERRDKELEIAEVERRIKDLHSRITTEDRFLREGEAGAARRNRTVSSRPRFTADGINVDLIRQSDHAQKQDDYRNRFRDREEARASAVATFDEFSMRRGISAGVGQRLASLRQQRQALMGGGTNFMAAEATTRGNSVDRIVEIANAKREAKQEAWQKTQIEKLDKQIELLEKLYAELRGGEGNSLLPAGLG